jgi:hypothetical protein
MAKVDEGRHISSGRCGPHCGCGGVGMVTEYEEGRLSRADCTRGQLRGMCK